MTRSDAPKEGACPAAYGAWHSPITARSLTSGGLRLGQTAVDGNTIYWIEGRPSEGGRSVLMRRTPGGRIEEALPPEINVRSRVHEYGGGAFAVQHGMIVFTDDRDRKLYCSRPGEEPQALTPAGPWTFADMIVDLRRRRVIAVVEETVAGAQPLNYLASVSLDGGTPVPLVSGADFYSAPRISPDGSWLVWLSWSHPDMPWDAAELLLAPIGDDGLPGLPRHLAGGPGQSACLPRWDEAGNLWFIAEPEGWWRPYRVQSDALEKAEPAEAMSSRAAEFGLPAWVFGQSTHAPISGRRALVAFTENGWWRLAVIGPNAGDERLLPGRYADLDGVQVLADGAAAVAMATRENRPTALLQIDLATGEVEDIRTSSSLDLTDDWISTAEPFAFPLEEGGEGYAYFYPPKNPNFVGLEGETPPAIVLSHGGPTGATSPGLNPQIQFWTTRGIAVVDVNYGGSTGFGRSYRQRIDGRWGEVDVSDCVAAADHLISNRKVDGSRLVAAGGSAGGYTTLCLLAFTDRFAAGISRYGIGNLAALAEHTHKFESRYLDRLVGPYPERADLYAARSPLNHAELISSPVLFLQGSEDKVVPPEQSEQMATALKDRGIPVCYLLFEGEQHGFRRADTQEKALDAMLYFLGEALGFRPADSVAPLVIDNQYNLHS